MKPVEFISRASGVLIWFGALLALPVYAWLIRGVARRMKHMVAACGSGRSDGDGTSIPIAPRERQP